MTWENWNAISTLTRSVNQTITQLDDSLKPFVKLLTADMYHEKLKAKPDHMDDEGPFDFIEDAERRQEWLEISYEMGYRVGEFEGKFYCVPSHRFKD